MSKNVTVTGTDKVNIVFRSTGDQDLKVGEGVPVVSTGNAKDKTAVVHGTILSTSINIQNPA
jgi:hypothetical protein